MVPFGLRIAWRRASWPTRRSPVSVKATTDGVVRLPSLLGTTDGSPPSHTAITELVVPRSMPTAFAMRNSSRSGACADSPDHVRSGTGGTSAGGLQPADQPYSLVGDRLVHHDLVPARLHREERGEIPATALQG